MALINIFQLEFNMVFALGLELRSFVQELTLISWQNGQFFSQTEIAALSTAFECSRFAHDGPGYVWFVSSVLAVPHSFEKFCSVHLSMAFECKRWL